MYQVLKPTHSLVKQGAGGGGGAGRIRHAAKQEGNERDQCASALMMSHESLLGILSQGNSIRLENEFISAHIFRRLIGKLVLHRRAFFVQLYKKRHM